MAEQTARVRVRAVEDARPVVDADVDATLLESLQTLGFTVLGRLTADKPGSADDALAAAFAGRALDAARRHQVRPARHVLAAPDGTAFAVVDAVAGEPLVRMRSLLDDASLLDTVGLRPSAQPDIWRRVVDTALLSSQASKRELHLGEDSDPAAVWQAHQWHLRSAAEDGRRPLPHEDLDQAVRLWQWALDHDVAVGRRAARVRAWGRFLPYVLAILFYVLAVAATRGDLSGTAAAARFLALLVGYLAGRAWGPALLKGLLGPRWRPEFSPSSDGA